jgi:hypothetical protein
MFAPTGTDCKPPSPGWTPGRRFRTVRRSALAADRPMMRRHMGGAMATDVVDRYQAALAKGDLERARSFLRDDLTFAGPFDTFDSAEDYWAAIGRLWTIVESIDVRHTSSAGDQVVVIYDMVTRTPAGTQLVCEWYGVEDDRIAWIRAIFDSAPFAFLRANAPDDD